MTLIPLTTPESKGKVLLTGGTGFIASHILDCLLDHGYNVVTTVRSQEKGERLLSSISTNLCPRVSYSIVPDIGAPSAWDIVLQQHQPLYVIHTASPCKTTGWTDPAAECLNPAINGTVGILKSITENAASSVKRVVITSSSAAILSPPNHKQIYDESCWADITWDQGIAQPPVRPDDAYRASKKFAEKSAWDFMTAESPLFSLATICTTLTLGPVQRFLTPPLTSINDSNQRILDMIRGNMKQGIKPTAPVFTFVDVRDVALAHVRAMERKEAANKRFYVIGGTFSNGQIAGIIRDGFEELKDKLPEGKLEDDFPETHWRFDNSRSKEVLGIKYKGLVESVRDTVASILEYEREGVKN
ncbi:putative NADPH-dependent methylglyoxal reductase [Podospora fimiseda]|uniref:NADPH-dependent methylglyoxal reductase n=1 Tax=Podospora fimiseda TaxID=252190 RepID=A0AAN7GVI6_9PEZI|nr:putative NADPH-dependent methylglyoxal reductase [Podospora fimiseda]